MSVIDLYQSLFNSSTFSFQGALSAYSGGSYDGHCASYGYTGVGHGYLYAASCVVNGTQNCTAACQDLELIFANPYTVQNCMVLASLGPVQSTNGSSTLNGITLSQNLTTATGNFSIDFTDPDFQGFANNVNQSITGCLAQYCNEASTCSTDTCPHGYACNWYEAGNGDPDAVFRRGLLGHCYYDMCGNVVVPLNADIGGIGVYPSCLQCHLRALTKPGQVYISYYMQTGIALAVLLLLWSSDSLSHRPLNTSFQGFNRGPPAPHLQLQLLHLQLHSTHKPLLSSQTARMPRNL